MTKSIVLLSGGLDSFVLTGVYKDKYGIELALTFDYGQKSLIYELEASKKICEYCSIKHKIINLDWLKEITHTSLCTEDAIPTANLNTKESASKVWVPNRNALFLNIAAAYADSYGYDYILFGANKDEGETFPDNTESFRQSISMVFETSTLKKPKVLAPLINFSKNDIVKIAMDNALPLEYVRSCYGAESKHCGKCESCMHLKNALIGNGAYEYLDKIF